MTNAKELKECLCCGSQSLETVLDLGTQPLANSFINDPEQSELTFPLILNRCTKCSHLQLSHAVNPDLLFKNYLYVSGTTQTLRDYFDWFAQESLVYYPEAKTVLDIACNDGSQLNSYQTLGLTTYGIDPAENLYKLSSQNHSVVCDYFTRKYVNYVQSQSRSLDIINAQNVFAHTDYPLEFLEMCRDLMHDESILIVQTSQADMIKNNEFDTIYHEHLSFFCANSMNELAKRAGLYLFDIRKTPIHGNSYMFVFSKIPRGSQILMKVLDEEREIGLQQAETYTAYAAKSHQVVEELKEAIRDYRGQGYVIAGYGAAAKGMTLLNFGEIQLDFVIDDNPLKQGLFTPGTHIPVVSSEILQEVKDLNVAFVPLAWNFFTEIQHRIRTQRTNSEDVFISYFPKLKVVQGN